MEAMVKSAGTAVMLTGILVLVTATALALRAYSLAIHLRRAGRSAVAHIAG